MAKSPAAILYDADGNKMYVQDGVAIPANTKGVLIHGTDGSNARALGINASQQAAIQDQPNMDVALSTRATETTVAGIKTGTDLIPNDPAREGGNLATLAGVDFATQTTLASVLSKLDITVSALRDAIVGTGPKTLTDLETTLDAIKDTDGVKKITDQLPAGTNNIGSIDSWTHDGTGNPLTSEPESGNRRLHVQTNFETDSGQIDAFARLRVSNPTTVFDSKRVSTEHVSLFWDTSTVGGGSVALQTQYARHRLSVAGGATDEAVVQTKAYFIYQPGKSLLYMMTFNAQGGVANVVKRIGAFDDNNGVFLELYGTTVNLVKRSNTSGSPVDTKVAQASWNIDPLNGSGASGKDIDWTKTQIMVCDLEWLGVGSARFGFILDGQIYYAHAFHHANIETVVYMKTPNQPIRIEIKALAASAATDFDAICQMVAVEGANEPAFVIRSADRNLTALSTDDTLRPLISIRLKYANTAIVPVRASCIAASASSFRQVLLINPTITGGTAASWTQATDSIVEYDIARDGIVSGGLQLDTTYASFKSDVGIAEEFSSMHYLGRKIDGTQDELVVAVQNIANPTEQYLGAMTWKEQV